MKEEYFIAQHEAFWEDIQKGLDKQAAIEDFPAAYRTLCQHLAMARTRNFSLTLVERINHLVIESHARFYKPKGNYLARFVVLIFNDFPQAVRQQWRVVLFSSLLFYLPAAMMHVAIQINPELAYSVMPPEQITEMEDMYEPTASTRHSINRDENDDVLMFGHYIYNNTSIGFRCFASGLLAGIGTIFFVLYNGLILGTVSGHLFVKGYAAETLYPFVIGHGAFELTAIVLSGACGLKLGWAMLSPKRRRRTEALKHAMQEILPIVYGMALMFFIAALIEAFWSPRAIISNEVKYTVGGLLWVGVYAYFLFAGRVKRGKS